jgi:hypothetical protein
MVGGQTKEILKRKWKSNRAGDLTEGLTAYLIGSIRGNNFY